MKSADTILSEYFIGKVIRGFEFGGEERKEYIGKEIEQVNIEGDGWDGDVGIALFVKEIEEPIFVYNNEGIDIY